MNRLDNASSLRSTDSKPIPGSPTVSSDKPTGKRLSASTETWSDAALKAGNKADKDPAFAKKVGTQLF